MKNFLNKLYSFIYSKKDKNNNLNLSNYILFELDKNGDMPNVKIRIGDTSKESSEQFGEMLYSLNQGLYCQSIMDLLMDISSQDEKVYKYIESVILWWKVIVAKNNKIKNESNSPLIKPTDFNKYVNK